ncbi:carbohydrate ABC transporter permease [Promicromonospora sp. Marseille-Q5078]
MSALAELRTLRRPGGRHERTRSARKEERAAYLFLLPWILGFLVITAIPMLASLALSFTDYNLLQAPSWVGLENITRMFHDARLHHSLWVTFVYVAVSVPLQLAVALGLAVALDKGLRGLAFYRSVYYLPSLLGGSAAVAILWRQMFGADGLVNQVLQAVGWANPPAWVSDPSTALGSLIVLNVWTFGAPMVIFLAGLRQVPRMYYEASAVDGATRWRQFRSITVPLLSPIIFFNLVLQIIHAFQAFTQAFIVSGGSGGPSDSTMFFTLYLYQVGFGNFQMGYASALAWLLVLVVAVFTGINFYLSKYWVFYDD